MTGTIINPAMPNLTRQGRAPSTVNKQMAVLSEMLKLANRSQFILHAPYEGVSRLKLSKNDPDPLLLHEYQALIAALPRSQALIIIVAVHTGMRPGEICALAWEDIDLVKGEIHVSRSLTNKRVFVPPKTDAGIRTITLLKPALDALVRNNTKSPALIRSKKFDFTIGRSEKLSSNLFASFFHRQHIRPGKAVISPRTRLPMAGSEALNLPISAKGTLISHGIPTHAGR